MWQRADFHDVHLYLATQLSKLLYDRLILRKKIKGIVVQASLEAVFDYRKEK